MGVTINIASVGIQAIVKRKTGVAVNADGDPFWTGNQVSAYASPLFFGGKDSHILVLCVDQQLSLIHI